MTISLQESMMYLDKIANGSYNYTYYHKHKCQIILEAFGLYLYNYNNSHYHDILTSFIEEYNRRKNK